MMDNLLRIIIYLIFITFCKSLHVLDNFRTDKSFSGKFSNTVKIAGFNKNSSDFIDLGFGSVINRRAVLTSALVISGRTAKELRVCTNCKRKSLQIPTFSCRYKTVLKIIYQKNIENEKKEELSVILIVKSYRRNGKIQPIRLVAPRDVINAENCFFVRWERVVIGQRKFGFLKIPFFPTNESGKHNIEDDHSRNSIDKIISRHVLNKFNGILGAPLICQLQNQSNYVQIGIATVNYTKYHLLNETFKDFIVTDGSFINITPLSKQIDYQLKRYIFVKILKKVSQKKS